MEYYLKQKVDDEGVDGEADIEGVAEVGEHLYWIGSHGRSPKGKPRVDRRALFATDPELKPVGAPYSLLLEDLLE